MTEQEWLTCDEPEKMLQDLFVRSHPGSRRLRLFLCACCRNVPALLMDGVGLETIETVERFTDGLAAGVEMSRAFNKASGSSNRRILARLTPSHARAVRSEIVAASSDGVAERGYQADLLRCIFGAPGRRAAFDPAWRTDSAVSLARGMYESRDFSAMPILADALQDAGCENADVLTHCRDPKAVHVRGCWVVDRVLGKE